MPSRIEDYALIGDRRSAALVGRDGAIDWLCLPRFDSPACFAALLGTSAHGRWLIEAAGGLRRTQRRYREDTLVLETELVTDGGVVRIIDFMPPDEELPNVVRIVEGVDGAVPMRMDLVIRFDYGSIIPWVRRVGDAVTALAGPDALVLRTPVPTHGENLTTVADFTMRPSRSMRFSSAASPRRRAPGATGSCVRSPEIHPDEPRGRHHHQNFPVGKATRRARRARTVLAPIGAGRSQPPDR